MRTFATVVLAIALTSCGAKTPAEATVEAAVDKPSPPQASADDLRRLQAAKDTACEQVAGLAKSMMEARQGGIAMTQVLEVAKKMDAESGTDVGRNMVMAAFDVPRFHGEEAQARAIQDFSNDMHLSCLKSSPM